MMLNNPTRPNRRHLVAKIKNNPTTLEKDRSEMAAIRDITA